MITKPVTGSYNPNMPYTNPKYVPPAGPKPPANNYDPFKSLPVGPEIDYRGGERGVEHDFNTASSFGSKLMDTYFGGQMNKYMGDQNLRNSILGGAAGAATGKMKDEAMGYLGQGADAIRSGLGQFGQSNAFFSNLMNNGMYSGGQMNDMLANAYGQATAAGRVAGDNINNAMAARGVSANPLAGAAMRLRAAMEGAGMRGTMNANLQREQAQSKIQGAQGHAQNASAMGALQQALAALMGQQSNLSMQQTQEGMMDFLNGLNLNTSGPDLSGAQGIYDQIRNLAIGPGEGLQAPENKPQFNPRGPVRFGGYL